MSITNDVTNLAGLKVKIFFANLGAWIPSTGITLADVNEVLKTITYLASIGFTYFSYRHLKKKEIQK